MNDANRRKSLVSMLVLMSCMAMVESSYLYQGRSFTPITGENSLRVEIQSMIEESPGTYFRSTIRMTNRTVGVIQYHLNWLMDHNKIVSYETHNYKGFFPSSMVKLPEKKKRALIMLRIPVKHEILTTLVHKGEIPQQQLVEEMKLTDQTLSYQLKILEKMELITRERTGLGKVVKMDEELRQFLLKYI